MIRVQADVFLATKPFNTFWKASKIVLRSHVKNGGKPPKIKINRKIFGKTEIFSYLCTKIENMRVISFSMIRDFVAKHADADVAMRDWYKRVCKANWNSFADIKQTFNTADYVGNDRYVFDIKGNNYRIIAIVLFINKKVYMRFVGTHEEYDRIKDIKNI
jgi:mRNA interferase HigB